VPLRSGLSSADRMEFRALAAHGSEFETGPAGTIRFLAFRILVSDSASDRQDFWINLYGRVTETSVDFARNAALFSTSLERSA